MQKRANNFYNKNDKNNTNLRQNTEENYFGDKSGHHYRNKNYIYKECVLYKLDCNQGIEVKRVTKELSGILTNIGYQRSI